jgi:hypothetical protein
MGKEEDLKDEVNHQVEVEIEPAASGASESHAQAGQTGGATGAATADSGTARGNEIGNEGAIAGRSDQSDAAGGTSAVAQSVQVKDINKISDSCSQGTSPGGMSGQGSESDAGAPATPRP